MNKLLTFLAFLAATTSSIAQDKEAFLDSYNDYANRKDAFALTINKQMMDAVDLDIDWKEQMKHISGDIHQLRFIVFGEDDNGTKIVQSFASRILKAGYPELRVDLDEDEDEIRYFKVFGKKMNGYYKDVHILMQDDDGRAYFFSINGKLKVKNQA